MLYCCEHKQWIFIILNILSKDLNKKNVTIIIFKYNPSWGVINKSVMYNNIYEK
jgi:hypothetical protein